MRGCRDLIFTIVIIFSLPAVTNRLYSEDELFSYLTAVTSHVERLSFETENISYWFRYGEFAENQFKSVSSHCKTWKKSTSERAAQSFQYALNKAVLEIEKNKSHPGNIQKEQIKYASKAFKTLIAKQNIRECIFSKDKGISRYFLYKINDTPVLFFLGLSKINGLY